jgi:hypothetical protein
MSHTETVLRKRSDTPPQSLPQGRPKDGVFDTFLVNHNKSSVRRCGDWNDPNLPGTAHDKNDNECLIRN